MGCCVSTKNVPKTTQTSPESDINGRDPPPAVPLEEETVKEVLSETPVPKQPTQISSTQKVTVEELNIRRIDVIKPAEEIVPEVSEICSLSESFSTTVVSAEDDGEVSQRIERNAPKITRTRPSSTSPAGGKERLFRSPTRRSAPSPEKRNHISSRSVQCQTTAMQRRNVVPSNRRRRDPGERSRSPLTRGEGGVRRTMSYRSPTLSTNDPSGGLSPVVGTMGNSSRLESPNDDVSPGARESLDNPVVSLECFIFL